MTLPDYDESEDTLPSLGVVIYPDDLIDLEIRAEKLTSDMPDFKAIKLRLGLAKSLFRHPNTNPETYNNIIECVREQLTLLNL